MRVLRVRRENAVQNDVKAVLIFSLSKIKKMSLDIIKAKEYFIPALLDIAEKYDFEIEQNKQENEQRMVIILNSRKLKKEGEDDFYSIQLWRHGIELLPPYRLRIDLYRGEDRFVLSPDIVNEIDVKTLYHIVKYLDSEFCN